MVFVAAAVDGMLRRLTVLEGVFAASFVVDERRFFTDEAPVCTACRLSPARGPLFFGATRAEVSIDECCANAEHLSTVVGEKASLDGGPPESLSVAGNGSDPQFDRCHNPCF